MTPEGNPSRARLLQTAADLFYREGIGAVGVDQLCRKAGVSKRSMYQLFASKDDLVVASLEEYAQRYLQLYFPEDSHGASPRTLLIRVFQQLEKNSTNERYAGCPYVSTAAELHDPQRMPSQVATRLKKEFTNRFRHLAELGGAADPETLAEQLTLLFDGAVIRSAGYGEKLAGLCATTAEVLLDAQGMTDDSPADGRS
ncbi:TetR/AcrR family transcriptional regulator [Saccharopolyspora sp. K220]|uniref:TetR/AcrR family transcriptional regulator n=1 Tax=Saccharopolyspora soli TaxID=2926618 RepID=UPI001F58784D|nr:TetR/AcrR family transcriptional regulator [Saccharopolyspora soli]MCI2418713.1 TetR/AcrR family transcriptional regulator [Saccharopolyspora soli]